MGVNPPAALTANQMDLDHDDVAALASDVQDYVRKMKVEYAQYVGGATCVLRFKPFIEVFHLGKLLVPQVQIGIQMYLNSPDFFTVRYVGADQLRLAPEDIKVKMLLCQVTLNPSVSRELFLKMDRHMVSYPAVRSELRTYNILAMDRYYEINNPTQNRVPNLVVVGLTKAAGFNGDVTKNPFAFGKFNLSSIKQLVRGEEYPYETLELKHDNAHKNLRGYHRFLEATGCLRKSKGNMVRKEDWGQGKHCTLFVFENAANRHLHRSVLNPKLSGELRMTLHFGANPGENLKAIVYAEFENILEIDRNKAVLYDVYDGVGRRAGGTSGLDKHAAQSIGLAPSRLGLAVRRRPPLRPTAFAPAHRNVEGVHRQHGSRGAAGTAFDRGVDRRQRVRDPGQLRVALGRLRNHAQPLQTWLDRHFKYVTRNGQSLQSLYSQSCGDYALLFLIARSQGVSMTDFLKDFSRHDYVQNDHRVGQRVKRLIHEEREWLHRTQEQGIPRSREGVRHLCC